MDNPNVFDDFSTGIPGANASSAAIPQTESQAFDWTKLPNKPKAPPRVVLDGHTVVIEKADMIMPPASEAWVATKRGDKETKKVQFKLFYSEAQQVEFLSGIRVFKQNEKGEYSMPTITRDGKNQASQLLLLYAQHKNEHPDTVTLFEFMSWLNSKPKVIIRTVDVTNPITGDVVKKNLPFKAV